MTAQWHHKIYLPFPDKQVDSLWRLNHKNSINLLGFCEEEEPSTRMMVLEYAANGTFYENLHGMKKIYTYRKMYVHRNNIRSR
jgi:hypothetical protein